MESKEMKEDTPSPKKYSNLCRFFAANGWCSFGDNCKFLHNNNGPGAPYYSRPRPEFRFYQQYRNPVDNFSINIDEATSENLSQLKKRDIGALERLYPSFVKTQEDIYQIDFTPTDPDWPFDVTSIKLSITFPPHYPKEMLLVKVTGPDLLPAILLSHLNWNIEKYLSSSFKENETVKQKYCLTLRPFLKFFDKNVRDYFVEGLKKTRLDIQAKAAGITFVPPPKREPVPVEAFVEEFPATEENENDDPITAEQQEDDDEGQDNKAENTKDKLHSGAQQHEKGDMELRFTDIDLSLTVATVEAKQLHFVVQCVRCKHRHDWLWQFKVQNPTVQVCEKCQTQHYLAFHPSQVHQYSAQLGWLKMNGATFFDLILLPSEFSVVCLQCNVNVSVTGLTWGQSDVCWCRQCHSKIEIKFSGVKVHGKQLSSAFPKLEGAAAAASSVKTKKVVKEQVLQEGKPLPDSGTCKHYKKSYRWFRFPCCGKLYPCDVCHTEREDHEIKFANRFVCGFCSKEQPYSPDKPCIACSSYVTKVSTAHWEGGRGCRDTSKMSNNDRQKFKNTNKTISNRAAAASKKQHPSKKTAPHPSTSP